MSEVTHYVALPFVVADDGIAPGEGVECFNPTTVVMKAEALSRKEGHIGAVAFSRTVIRQQEILATQRLSENSATYRTI